MQAVACGNSRRLASTHISQCALSAHFTIHSVLLPHTFHSVLLPYTFHIMLHTIQVMIRSVLLPHNPHCFTLHSVLLPLAWWPVGPRTSHALQGAPLAPPRRRQAQSVTARLHAQEHARASVGPGAAKTGQPGLSVAPPGTKCVSTAAYMHAGKCTHVCPIPGCRSYAASAGGCR